MSDKEYYIIDNQNQQIGPFTFKELKKMRLRPHTHVWVKGPGNWQFAKDIKGLVSKDVSYWRRMLILFIILIGLVSIAVYITL